MDGVVIGINKSAVYLLFFLYIIFKIGAYMKSKISYFVFRQENMIIPLKALGDKYGNIIN